MNDTQSLPESIDCHVYRASKRADTYVFMPAADDVAQLPEGLRAVTGKLELALELTLTPDRQLARAEAPEVMRSLLQHGFYLQLPPPDEAV